MNVASFPLASGMLFIPFVERSQLSSKLRRIFALQVEQGVQAELLDLLHHHQVTCKPLS